jgi:GNAT superfamily N-acetyltransferase
MIVGGAGLTIRDAMAPDREFIVGTLIPSAWQRVRDVRRTDWCALVPAIEAFVCSQAVKVCCMVDDPGVMVGWAAAHKGKLIYVYVKKDFRGYGIGFALREAVTGDKNG